MPSQYDPLLRRSQLFSNLSEADRDRVAELVTERRFHADELLFRQGERGTELFVVAEGRIKVFLEDGPDEIVLANAAEGTLLGETSLLTGAPRSATGRAETDGCVLVIAHRDFQTFLASNPDAMLDMARLVALRQVQANAYRQAHERGGLIQRVERLRGQMDEARRQSEVGAIGGTQYLQQLERADKQQNNPGPS